MHVCDESQICYHMTWQKMFNSCTCAKFRQILLDVSNKMFQVNIQCQTNAYNNFPHWLSMLCGILDAFSPYRSLSLSLYLVLSLFCTHTYCAFANATCPFHRHSNSVDQCFWHLLHNYSFAFNHSKNPYTATGPYHNRTNLNRKPQTQCSLILGKPFEVEWMSK